MHATPCRLSQHFVERGPNLTKTTHRGSQSSVLVKGSPHQVKARIWYPDCTSFQPHPQPPLYSFHSTVTSRYLPSCPIFAQASLERCRELLVAALRTCTNESFPELSCAISCVLTAKRTLYVSELKDAISLHSQARSQRCYVSVLSLEQFAGWLRNLGALFRVSDTGHVSFQQEAMPQFLRGYRVLGIDASHRTIAMLCLEQNKLEEEFKDWEPVREGRSVFARYAKEYGQYHCRIAQKTSLSLTFDKPMERVLPADGGRRTPCAARGSVSVDSVVIQDGIERLDLDDDGQEWTIV